MQSFFKKALPHILALSIAFLITFFYLMPAFKGKALEQHDINQWRGGAQEIIDYKEQHNGEQPHWTNSMFSGMPSYFVNMLHEGNKTGILTTVFYKNFRPPVIQTVIAIICFYVLMASLGFSPWVSIFGAFAYAYASFNFVSLLAGHNAKLNAYATIPLMYAGIVYALHRKKAVLGAILFCTGLALNLNSNHFQVTYYAIVGAAVFGLYFVIEAIINKQIKDIIKPILLLIVAAVVGVGTNASAILTTQEYSEYSIRGKSELHDPSKEASSGIDKSYAFEYSYGIGEIATFFVPGIYGGSSGEPIIEKTSGEKARYPLYHGELGIAGGTIYIGAIIFALALMSIFVVRNNAKWAFWVIALIGFVLAWGKNLESVNYFLFEVVPGLNKFRSVMMAIMISQFAFTVLAAMTLNEIFVRDWKEAGQKEFKNGLLAVGGVFVITLFAIMSMNFSSKDDANFLKSYGAEFVQSLIDYRKDLAYSDFFRSVALAAISLGLIYFVVFKNLFKKNILMAVLGVLLVFDLIGVDKRYLNKDSFVEPEEAQSFQKTAIDDFILKDKTLSYRVYNLQGNPFTDARTSYFHKSLGGYNPAKLRRYQDLIEKHLYENNFAVVNMLNAKYIIVNEQQNPVRVNPEALGNAWFVKTVKYVKNPDEELAALKGFDPANVAIIDESKFKAKSTSYITDSSANLVLTEYKPQYLKYTSTNTHDGLAVFSEIYYPKGWTIKIDGKEVNMLRVNYVLRALEVPAGTHNIEFAFESVSYKKGYTISFICSVLMLVAFAGMLGYEVFKAIKEPKTNS